jgi:hypothetical protein
MPQNPPHTPLYCPLPSEPEEPKLSLQHLMIGTICAAVGCSASRSLLLVYETQTRGHSVIGAAIDGLMLGAGLAGFLLLASRRIRHRVFPRHAGEMLWLMIGIEAVLNFVRYLVLFSIPLEWFPTTQMVFGFAILVIWTCFYFLAIAHTKQRRWKMVFVLIVASHVAAWIVTVLANLYLGPGPSPMGIAFGRQLLVLLAVACVATIDTRQGRRYPWTHWVGILLLFCNMVFAGIILMVHWISGG